MTLKWTEYQKLRVTGQENNVPWWTNDKLRLSKFLQENQLPTPKIYNVWNRPNEVDLFNVPTKEFVLKPSVMHSAMGVMVLKKYEDSELFFDSLSNKDLSIEDIIKIQETQYEKCKFKGSYKIFMEEKINSAEEVGDIPFDYKIYCFYGIPKMICQINRNVKPPEVAFFDGEFRPLNLNKCIISNWKLINEGKHILPLNWQYMLDVASKISIIINSPFISVDMFSSSSGGGAVIGELTPAPGGPYYGDMYKFTESFDLELGQEWETALTKISY